MPKQDWSWIPEEPGIPGWINRHRSLVVGILAVLGCLIWSWINIGGDQWDTPKPDDQPAPYWYSDP